ncbi:peptidoglycan-binding protein [Hungatella effluvii]|uniref:C40 family peptidase n=1 Tax=Hungatella effluvii TaxID=1096246 RepID=UPI0022E19900|nr:peptidoglycan-binding protein [Hungatella effluvii]
MNKQKKQRMKWYIMAAALAAVLIICLAAALSKGKQPDSEDTEETLPMKIQAENQPEIVIEGEDSKEEDSLMGKNSETADAEESEEAEPEGPAPENLKEGVEHSAVSELQARLMELGFMENDEPTRFYGPVTAASVKRFQRQNNLEQDGIAGPQTREMILSPDAKYYAVFLGISGDDVKQIQNRLYELGYLVSADNVNGTFDELTEKAVIKLQEINLLNADGKVGKQTVNLLYSESVKPNFLSYGEESDTVLKFQKRLKELGYLTTNPDGNYGKDTVQAIKQFQSRNGLVVDGYLGPTTRNVMEESGARPNGLVLGEQGDSVKRVQELLSQYGYLPSGNVTGYYGEITEAAVVSFQKNNSLAADGSVGINTMAKLTDSSKAVAKGKASGESGSSGGRQQEDGKRSVSGSVQALINAAASKVGLPYVWGSKGPNSFDCSGFVYWCLNQVGVRQSYLTSSGWRNIGKYKKITNYNDIQPGDIIVENGHMGIAAEDGKVIDASSGNGKVVYRKRTKWWRDNFIVAWRIF